MKKRIALILTGTMLMGFVLSACGDNESTEKKDEKTVLKHLQMQITGLHLQ